MDFDVFCIYILVNFYGFRFLWSFSVVYLKTNWIRRNDVHVFCIIGSKAKHRPKKLAEDNDLEDLPEEEEDFDDMEDLNMYDLIEEQQVEDDVSEMETEMLECV